MVQKARKKLNEVGAIWKATLVTLLFISLVGVTLFSNTGIAREAYMSIWEFHAKKIGALTADGEHEGIEWLNDPDFTGSVNTENWNMSHQSGQKNWLHNVSLGVWSGGTISATYLFASQNTDGANAAPDGWRWSETDNVLSGASRMDVQSITTAGTGATEIYPGLTHSVHFSHSGNYGTSDWLLYPDSSVSSQQHWYGQFVGKQITFGALIWVDEDTTGATNLVRPFIRTSASGATPYGGNCTFGPYATGDSNSASARGSAGWEFLSASTTVPDAATALDFGFEIWGHAYSSSQIGTSGYMCGPTLTSGATIGFPIMVPGEVVYLDNPINLANHDPAPSTAISYGAGGSTIDVYSASTGQIPRDVDALLFTLCVGSGTTGDQLSLRRTSSVSTGVSWYIDEAAQDSEGDHTGMESFTGWVKTDHLGRFFLVSGNNGITGASPIFTAVKMR